MAGLLRKSVVFFIALVVCFISTSAELKRLEHSTKVDGSLSFLVVGDWGRRGAYNQSQVALQVVCQSQHQGRPMSILDAMIDLSGRSQLLMVHWIPNFSQMGRIGEKLDIDFVISTGDNFYEDGLTGINDVAFLESFSNIYTAKSLQTNWYSVLGNHDYRGDEKAQTSHVLRKIDSRWFCLRSFLLDAAEEKKIARSNLRFLLLNINKKKLKCSKKKKNVVLNFFYVAEIAEFFFVDTTPFVDKYFTHSEEQEHTYDWRGVSPRNKYLPRLLKDVESALRESTAKWKIVVGHHTIRSISQHGDTAELVEKLLPILQAYDVDFYMNGHDHCLEHIRSTNSPLQFLTSGGGSKAWRGDIKGLDQDGVEFFYDGQGFMSVQLNKNAAKFQFYDVGGKVLHSWNIFKQLHSSV